MVTQSSTKRPCIAIVAQFPLAALENGAEGRGAGQQATWLPQLAMSWENQTDFDIHWCVLAHKAKNNYSKQKWNQSFHHLPTTSVTCGMLAARWPQRLAFRKIFKTIKPDLVHCWGTENLLGASLDEFRGPTVLSMQGLVGAYLRTGGIHGWRWNLLNHWEPRSMRMASVVTSESRWGLARVNEISPGKKVQRIEYGVNPSFYDVEWKPDPKDPYLVVAGGMNRLKGTDILQKILASSPGRSWRIVFAGTGDLEASLRQLNDPGITFAGMLKTAELQTLMSRAWVLVHPARADTSPNVVKEARVIGLPVIGSPHGGHADYIEDGIDGYLVPSEEPGPWRATIESLTEDYEKTVRMGTINRDRYRAFFDPCLTSAGFLSLYRELLPA